MSGAPEPLLFDLSARAKFFVHGGDALRFLNGQVTNDVGKATRGHATEACVLNAKGKIDAHIFLRANDEGFLLDAEPELREALVTRLDRYIIADDVAVEDVTDKWALFHTIGDAAESVSDAVALRLDRPGRDVWVAAAEAEAARNNLSSRCVSVSGDQAELYRIEHGIPRWGRELTSEIIPMEANLETRAIDFAKGCYIGQEVISRMKMSGQTSKRLCGLISVGPLSAETRLTSVDGKDVGWITSATRSDRLNAEIAMGFVKRGFNAPATPLIGGEGNEANVQIVALPFV